MAINFGGYTPTAGGPPYVPTGGELSVASRPAPGSAGAAVPLGLVTATTGMAVTGGAAVATSDAAWAWIGGILFKSKYATEYTIDIELWLSWVLPWNQEVATSNLVSVSGLIGGGAAGAETVLAVGCDFEFSMIKDAPVTLWCRTFGRDADTTMTLEGGFLVSHLQKRLSATRLLSRARPPGAPNSGPVVPYSGTDKYMVWSEAFIPGDRYRRGLTVTHTGGMYIANKDNPAGEPGSSTDWTLVPGGGKPPAPEGGFFRTKDPVSMPEETDTKIPLIADGLPEGVELDNGGIKIKKPGSYSLSGTVTIGPVPPSTDTLNLALDSWFQWKEEDGETRLTPKTSAPRGDASAAKPVDNRLGALVVFDITHPVTIELWSWKAELDSKPAQITATVGLSLLMPKGKKDP